MDEPTAKADESVRSVTLAREGCPMTGQVNRSEFVRAYTRVLTHAWGSVEFSTKLYENPKGTLALNGLATPSAARVEILNVYDAEPDLAAQADLWNRGFVSGCFVLCLPALSQTDTAELSVDELGDLAGGAAGWMTVCWQPAP
jgi:hypothetical protein